MAEGQILVKAFHSGAYIAICGGITCSGLYPRMGYTPAPRGTQYRKEARYAVVSAIEANNYNADLQGDLV